MSKNHHRADHRVTDVFGDGFNVTLSYGGYEVSLACDGENTAVYADKDSSDQLFSAPTTTGEAIKACFAFIDSL